MGLLLSPLLAALEHAAVDAFAEFVCFVAGLVLLGILLVVFIRGQVVGFSPA